MRSVGFALVMICLGGGAMTAQQTVDSGSASRVLALEHAWNQAEERKDIKAMDALFDSELIYVDYDGTLRNKTEFLLHLKAISSQPQQETTESMAAHTFGSTVVVTGVYLAKGVENGKAYVRHGRFVDTWVFGSGKWLCVSSQSTPIPN